jgi:hypothetical protein
MNTRTFISIFFFSVFVLCIVGCSDAPKQTITQSQKIGLTPEERKDKRGE